MSERSRFIKVRVSDAEYRELRRRADEHGVTMSQHVRTTVTTVHQSVDVATELVALRQQLRQGATPSPAPVAAVGTEQREILLLVRELAATRDAQILARVRAQLATRVNGNEQRGGGA